LGEEGKKKWREGERERRRRRKRKKKERKSQGIYSSIRP
jgi:hypothetical protein